jgi:hypothetical protein
MDIEDALAELEAVGIATANTTDATWAGTTITTIADNTDPNFQPAGTSVGNDLSIDANGDVVFGNGTSLDGWYDSAGTGRATLQMGALTLSPQENGDVEIVMDVDGLREEYHINADKVRSFLRGIADVVVEGKET